MSLGWRRKAAAIVGALAMVVSSGSVLLQSQPAHAYVNCSGGPYVDFGRYEHCGYFNNNEEDFGGNLWNNGVPNSVNDMTSFINWVVSNRNSANASDRTSSEFLIDTMEGLYPPNNTRGAAWTLEPDWETRLKKGVAEGILAVQWFYAWPWNCGQHNTYYQPTQNDVGFYITSPASLETPPCGPGVTTTAIRFYDPRNGTNIYTIKRSCGNPIGNMNALPKIDYTLDPSGFVTPDYQMTRGDTGTMHVELDNLGPSQSENGTLKVNVVKAGTTVGPGSGAIGGANAITSWVNQPCAPNCSPGSQTNLTKGATNYTTGRGYNGDWYWNYKPLPASGNGNGPTGRFDFTIANTAQVGFITFNICAVPGNQNGATICNHVTVQIVSKRTPNVVGLNGDAQAGGAIGVTCPTGTPAGHVQGNTTQGSYDQYVVSASGSINNQFGSDSISAASPNAQKLKLGPGGSYSCIARPDLMYASGTYRAGSGGRGTIGNVGGVGNQLADSLGAFSVYYFDGSDLYIHGLIKKKITIVATAGTVHIDGNLTIDPGSTGAGPRDEPSLGIIAKNIYIKSAVTQVDAYLYAQGSLGSDGIIDTCEEGQSSDTACNGATAAAAKLTVNGFLMGRKLDFRRTGQLNSFANSVTEQIELTPQLYLNPPMFFDATVDQILEQSLGEKQPLF